MAVPCSLAQFESMNPVWLLAVVQAPFGLPYRYEAPSFMGLYSGLLGFLVSSLALSVEIYSAEELFAIKRVANELLCFLHQLMSGIASLCGSDVAEGKRGTSSKPSAVPCTDRTRESFWCSVIACSTGAVLPE